MIADTAYTHIETAGLIDEKITTRDMESIDTKHSKIACNPNVTTT
jgi:hypothetical protein